MIDQRTVAGVADADARARIDGRRLLRNDVFELVLQRILRGTYPPGQRLRDADLTEWLQVSRTPVREAVSRLAAVGLVSTSPNRYTEVTPLDEGDIADAVAVLRLLWPVAVGSARTSSRMDTEIELTMLTRLLERGELDPADGFHRTMTAVTEALPNRVLAEALRAADLRVMRYLLLVPEAREVLQRERVAALARALCAEWPEDAGRAGTAAPGRATALVLAVLDDLDEVLDCRRSAAR